MGQINSPTNKQAQLVQDFSETIEELSGLSVEMKALGRDLNRLLQSQLLNV